MEEKPVTAEPEKKPRRRWYQFGLRTLLIGVALVSAACGYVADEASIVRKRNALRERIEKMGAKFTLMASPTSFYINLERNPMPFPRNWLGDARAGGIEIPATFSGDDIASVRRVFPEAWLYRFTGSGCEEIQPPLGATPP
jgi:hypothetical protein